MKTIIDRLEKIKYSAIPRSIGYKKKKVTETNICLNDTIEGKVGITLYGNSEQKTRSGKNLINTKKLEIGNINSSDGQDTPSDLVVRTEYIKLKAGNYSFKIHNINNTIKIFKYALYDSEKTYISTTDLVVKDAIITVDNDSYIRFAFYEASWGSITIDDVINSLPQLEEGSTASEYEQYGVSPSPDYPSEIKTVKGIRNLFDKDNANILEGTIDGNLNTLNLSTGRKTIYISCEPNTTYTIQKMISSRFLVAYTTEYPAKGVGVRGIITKNNDSQITITTDANANYLCVFYYHDGYDTTITEEEVRNSIMIEEGSVANKYIPYGAWEKVKVTGKNLFNKGNIILQNGYIQNNGTLSGTASDWLGTLSFVKVKPNTEYVISAKNIGTRLIYAEYSSNDATTVIGQRKEITPKTSFKTSDTTNFIRFSINNPDTTDIQIEQGTTITEYEAYKEKEILIDLQDNELCSIGDTKDTLKAVSGELTKRIGKVVLDGSENWTIAKSNNTTDTSVRFWLPFSLEKTNYAYRCLSSHYKESRSWDNHVTDNNSIVIFLHPNWTNETGRLSIHDNRFTTVTEFKAWLSENPVIIYYQLATPYEVNLSTENIPKTFKDITYISNADNTEMEVTYYSNEILDIDNFKITVKEI